MIQKVAVLAVDDILLKRIDANLLRKIDSQYVEVTLVKNLQPLLQALLAISKDLHNVSEDVQRPKKKVSRPSHPS